MALGSNESEFLIDIAGRFDFGGRIEKIEELKLGHINSTFIVSVLDGANHRKLVLQRVNHHVFKDVPALMRNLEIVTSHIKSRISREGDATLTLLKTRGEGKPYLTDVNGDFWRVVEYIEDTVSFEICPNREIGYATGAIMARFQGYLSDLDTSLLVEPIPYFQHAPRRFDALREAVKVDCHGRVRDVQSEIDYALGDADIGGTIISALEAGRIPLRVTHADMKLNNILFKKGTTKAVCVVDLDTCMPGSLLYDFGDLLRCTSVLSAEDEQDLSKVKVDASLFRVITEGYLASAKGFITKEEVELLALAPRVLALTLGARFLTDHINGDTYFRIHRPNQNLDRARTQFQVARIFTELEPSLKSEILSLAKA